MTSIDQTGTRIASGNILDVPLKGLDSALAHQLFRTPLFADMFSTILHAWL